MVLVTGVVAYFTLLRPLLRAIRGPDSGRRDPAAADDVRVSLSGRREGPGAPGEGSAPGDYAAHLDRARELARTDPRLVAHVIREWMK